jgi:superfamily II DNA or RNA helicase
VDAPDRLYVTEHCILTHNTIQACGVLNLARPKRTVVGCPAFLTRNWANEIERWCVDPQPIAILDGAKKALPDSGILILPYSRGHTFAEQIAAGPPIDLLIMDEVHFLKSSDARRTKCWLGEKGLARRADRVVALSGTPMPNNPLELYGLLSVLAPELLRGVTRDRFKELYCSTVELPMNRRNAIGQKIPIEKVSAKSTSVLNAELRASGVMVRRDKAEVLTQLPSKNIFFVHMQPDAEIETLVREEASLYDQLQMKLLSNKELMEVRGHVATVRQRLGVLKAPMIAEYVRNIFASGEDRVVVFMLHLEAIDEVRRAVGTTPDVEALVLTGSESPRVRQERVDKFQKPGGKRLIIGQTTAAGVGLTMTAARFGVLGEISWVPAWNEQAIDRLHRITQTKQVEIAVITFPHAIEERVVRANARKALDARAVLDENLMRLLDSAPEEALKTAAE